MGPIGPGWSGCGGGPEVFPRRRPGPVGREVQESRGAEEAIRAGTAMRWVRRVDHRAFAGRAEAAAPAAGRRLNDRQASASQAGLAVNFPDGACARGPSFSSAMTCSMIAWSRWVSSAAIAVRVELVTNPW